jgi:hypothetical protein
MVPIVEVLTLPTLLEDMVRDRAMDKAQVQALVQDPNSLRDSAVALDLEAYQSPLRPSISSSLLLIPELVHKAVLVPDLAATAKDLVTVVIMEMRTVTVTAAGTGMATTTATAMEVEMEMVTVQLFQLPLSPSLVPSTADPAKVTAVAPMVTPKATVKAIHPHVHRAILEATELGVVPDSVGTEKLLAQW